MSENAEPSKKIASGWREQAKAQERRRQETARRAEVIGQRIKIKRLQSALDAEFSEVGDADKPQWLKDKLLDQPTEYSDGDLVILERNGHPKYFVYRNFKTYFHFDNPNVKELEKFEPVQVRLSIEGEKLQSTNDAMSELTVLAAGYPIITNPGEPAYLFKQGDESVEAACKRFLKLYHLQVGDEFLPQTVVKPGTWKKIKKIRVVPIGFDDVPVAIRSSVDNNTLMGVDPGGAVSEGGYTIADTSIAGNPFATNPSYRYVT